MCACVLCRFSHLALCNPGDCSLPGSSVHGILQSRILEWVAMPGDLSHLGLQPTSPLASALQADSIPLSHWEAVNRISSIQFSCSVMSDSLRPHGLQHARPLCPSPTPRVYSNSCPLRRWCHPTISSSVVPFFSHLQSFTATGSFQMSQFFASAGQSIGVSASASVLPVNIQDWFPLGWTGWISLQSKGLSRVFSNTTVQKHWPSAFFIVQLSHPYMTTGKNQSFD